LVKTKEKKRETKTSRKKKAKAQWMWVEQLYLEIDEMKGRLTELENSVRLIKEKLNIK